MFVFYLLLPLLLAAGIRGGVIQGEKDGASDFAYTDAKKIMLMENRFPKNYPLVKEPGIMVQMVPNLPSDLFNAEKDKNGKMCDECKSVLTELAQSLQDEKIVAQYKRAFKLFCMLTIRRAADCEALADSLDMIIENLKDALNDPEKVCVQIHFCSPTQPDLISRLVFFVLKSVNFEVKLVQKKVKSVDVICDECVFMVNELTTILSDPLYQKDIQGTIKHLCHVIPQVKSECEYAVDAYAPAVFENLLDYLANPRPFCQRVGMCKGSLVGTVPMTELVPAKAYDGEMAESTNSTGTCPFENLKTSNGLPAGCVFCKCGLTAVIDFLTSDTSLATLEEGVLAICDIFPTDWNDQCTDFMHTYFKPTAKTALADFDAKKTCESLKVCSETDKLKLLLMSSEQRKATVCEACKLIVEFSRNQLSSPTYQLEIIEEMSTLCQLLPIDKAKQTKCQSVVRTYGPFVFDDVLVLLLQPEQFCRCLLTVEKFVLKLMMATADKLADESICAKFGQCGYRTGEVIECF